MRNLGILIYASNKMKEGCAINNNELSSLEKLVSSTRIRTRKEFKRVLIDLFASVKVLWNAQVGILKYNVNSLAIVSNLLYTNKFYIKLKNKFA